MEQNEVSARSWENFKYVKIEQHTLDQPLDQRGNQREFFKKLTRDKQKLICKILIRRGKSNNRRKVYSNKHLYYKNKDLLNKQPTSYL